MGNFWVFVKAVADSWFFWIGTGLIIQPYIEGAWPAMHSLIKRYYAAHPQGRQKLFRRAGAIALLFACYQAWNIQYEGRLLAVTQQGIEPLEKRLAMKTLIGTAIDDGEELGKNWFQKDDQPFLHDTNTWTNKVGNLIEDAYGKGELKLWMSDAGYISYSDGKKHTEVHNWIIHRLQRLNDLLQRVDSIPMQRNFDPKNYKWVEQCSDPC